ncbi:cytoskeleton-associated protein 2-like [Betta splendens]|uniref:Cytoskeleton-associated protein 2-like n=1 Tax=Betta splendens TaxID=158456 RepID=A0A6P7NMY5_BETSP|nr:cytoskeleton-associated protein 2-like [Betta splendens]XP_055368146.1 cytoskeleton-associated protein 2-like [Betta splendens]XP_055368147.1 cytoskeleton-associated protein 2-like [Betta splendens]XP_055368148.1 cytoskeleton-associated protein 2-like [Betta splendens]
MEQGEVVSRKELRKQKLMEYLATKGKQKLPNPNSTRFDCPVKKPLAALKAVLGKENKVPAQKVGYEASKVKPLPVHCTKIPTRGVLSDLNKGNATRGFHDKQSNERQISVLRSTYTVISSKPNPNAPRNTEKPFSAKVSSNVGRTTVSASHSRFTSRSNVALSGPVNVRVSLGPLVKTKTGLIPAVTQPRTTHSHLIRTSETAPGNILTTNSKKAACRPLSSVSQRTSTAQKKVISTTAATNPVHVKSTLSMSARFRKNEVLIKSNLKPPLVKHSQPSCKSQIGELKSAPLSSRREAATVKPQWKAGMSTTSQSACENTGRSIKKKYEDKGKKNNRISKVTSQASLEPLTRSSSSSVRGTSVAGMAAKTMKCRETQSKSGRSSAHVLSQQMGKNRDVQVMSKTVPQPARTVSLTGKLTELKTPKVPVRAAPQTERKKLSAAQEERIKKLQEWREAKGISYKRPPMPVKAQVRRTVAVPQPFWTAMKEEDEAHSLIQAVDRALADCIKLLEEGCPLEQVKRVLTRLPAISQKFAKYWICQARLMEQEGNLDVLPMFKEAVLVVLEPVDELRTVVFEILKKKDETQASEQIKKDQDQMPSYENPDESSNNLASTPEPVRALINGEKGDSSVVKFKITATPGGPVNRPREPVRVNGQEVRFFTPVRRSVRIERASSRYPASLQDHDLCVASYNDLLSKEEEENREKQGGGKTSPSADGAPMYIYRQNEALEDKVSVQLVYDEVV